MSLGEALHQKLGKPGRTVAGRGEAGSEAASDEAKLARHAQTDCGADDLLGQALARENMARAWKRVNRLAKRIADKPVLRLIRAGILMHGVSIERHEGTPQGGPLSPLLANVLLDEVDRELERRGHKFVRYADDCAPRRRTGGAILLSSHAAQDLSNNLYKLSNWLASGSYMPRAVRRVEIPKADGGTRPLGIPTIADRIAQTVVKQHLEPKLEEHFHEDSYGYRPGKSARQALDRARRRCWDHAWVVDLDIKGFFDTIDHELLMRALRKHTAVLLYVRRWLEAPVELTDGQTQVRALGTPQGGVISPLLANLFLHYVFDRWIQSHHPDVPFERYADDALCHCRTQAQAAAVLAGLTQRFAECGLTLHPQKTRLVYCKDDDRRGDHPETSFDFLGYTFRARRSKNRWGKYFVNFSPGMSAKAGKRIRQEIRSWKLPSRSDKTLHDPGAHVRSAHSRLGELLWRLLQVGAVPDAAAPGPQARVVGNPQVQAVARPSASCGSLAGAHCAREARLVRALAPLVGPRGSDGKSRMSREAHVRLCERLEGRFLRATRRNVYVRSRKAGERVLQALRGCNAKLALKVNESKTAVASVWGRKFLGYCFWASKDGAKTGGGQPGAGQGAQTRPAADTSHAGLLPRTDRRGSEGLRAWLEGVLPAGANAQGRARAGRMAATPTAGRAAQAVAARDDDVPRAAQAGRERGPSRTHRRQRPAVVAQQRDGAEPLPADRPLRPPGSPAILLTSTSRTARCAPACRVVWEGPHQR